MDPHKPLDQSRLPLTETSFFPNVDYLYHQLDSCQDAALSIIDDACYERTEAMLAIMISDFHVSESRLGRAFIMNSVPGAYLSQTKPLARGENPLSKWFHNKRARGELFQGAKFTYDGQTFRVNEFDALVCESMPQIYFDERAEAYWGIGHAAPVVDGLVLYPTLGKGPLLLSEWSQCFDCNGLIPLLGDVDRQPHLATTFLSEDAKHYIIDVFSNHFERLGVGNSAELMELLHCLPKLPYSLQHDLYNTLFENQIRLGAIVPHEYWSPLFPGPLTFRGQVYGNPSATRKLIIHADLASTWEERKERALQILAPFRAFHALILSDS